MKLEPYPQYSPSTVPENPLRPSHWEVKPLKYLIAPGVGYKAGPFGSALITSKLNEIGEVAVLSPEDVANGLDPADFARFLPESRVIEMKAFEVLPQDVVFPIGGTLGRAAVMPTGCRGILHQRLARIRTDPNILVPEFLKLLLSDYSGFKALDELERRGAILHHLTREQFLNRRIAIPTVPEQLAILMFVKTETSKVDALIGKQERLIATLREDRTATITHAVTKGIDPEVEMRDSGVEWLGDMPKHWVRARLRDVVVSIDSGTSVNGTDVPAEQGEVGVLKTSCVSAGWFNPQANKAVLPEEASRVSCPVRAGQVIVNRANTPDLVGSAGYVAESADDLYLSDLLWALSTTGVKPQFLHLWMQTPVYRTQVAAWRVGTSASMQKVSKASLRAFSMALPPESEQRQVVDFLTARTATIDALIAKAHAVIETIREYRSALITDAVTGKIDVREVAA
jgi:restriction endonuclease S subunit